MLIHIITGFVSGLALIIAIGAQNAMLLRQGLLRQHVLPLVLFCSITDASLIVMGAGGLGALIETHPALLEAIRYGGAAFLGWYGIQAVRRAASPSTMELSDTSDASLWLTLSTMAVLTFLNPHVYLDTVILLGALASDAGDGRWAFVGGAVTASFVWFFSLGYGARLLAPWFEKPIAWRVLDGFIALVMMSLAIGLVF